MNFDFLVFVPLKEKKIFWLLIPLKNLIPLETNQFHQHNLS